MVIFQTDGAKVGWSKIRPGCYDAKLLLMFSGSQGNAIPHPEAQPRLKRYGVPIPWSRVLLPFYRKILDRSTQFGAVGYIITLYSSKSYVKTWGSVKILGVRTPDPSVVAPMPPPRYIAVDVSPSKRRSGTARGNAKERYQLQIVVVVVVRIIELLRFLHVGRLSVHSMHDVRVSNAGEVVFYTGSDEWR